jgi:hypothetical protein
VRGAGEPRARELAAFADIDEQRSLFRELAGGESGDGFEFDGHVFILL